jgi:hypothetical protein
VSTRWAGVAVVALVGVSAGAAEPDGVYFEDRRAPVDIEGVLAPRKLATESAPAGPLAARLVWMDPTRAAAGVDGIARDEVRALLRKLDVSAAWRMGEPGEVARPGEVCVILLDRAAEDGSGEPILGATPPHFDGPPFVWIHVPNVRATVGLRADGPLAVLDMHAVRAFGLALGRVIGHELVHVMAPSAPHGKGLMSEKLTSFQLTAARLDVEPSVRTAVRAALRGEAAPPPTGAGVLAATANGKKPER